ncbi:hypothetical protein Bca4012_042333 [Brassica carinata]
MVMLGDSILCIFRPRRLSSALVFCFLHLVKIRSGEVVQFLGLKRTGFSGFFGKELWSLSSISCNSVTLFCSYHHRLLPCISSSSESYNNKTHSWCIPLMGHPKIQALIDFSS